MKKSRVGMLMSRLITLNAVILDGNGLSKSSAVIDVNILSCNTTDRSMHPPMRFGIPLINALIASNDAASTASV